MKKVFLVLFIIITKWLFAQPNAGYDETVCGNTIQLNGSLEYAVGSTYYWTSSDGCHFIPSNDVLNPYTSISFEITEDMVIKFYLFETYGSVTKVDSVQITFLYVVNNIDVGNDTAFCQNPTDQYIGFIEVTGGYGTGIWNTTQWETGYAYVNQSSTATQVTSNHPGTENFCWRESISAGFPDQCIITDCKSVTFEPTPNTSLLMENAYTCGLMFASINGSIFDGDTAYWIDSSFPGTVFYNNSPSGLTNPNNVNDTVAVEYYGIHQLNLIACNRVEFETFDICCTDTANPLFITFYENPVINFTPAPDNDTIYAADAGFVYVDAGSGEHEWSYLWNTGDTTQNVEIDDWFSWYSVYVEDTLGCSSYDSVFVVLIENVETIDYLNNFEVFPNPSNGIFYVNYESIEKIEVYDANGKVIFNGKKSEVDIRKQRSGMYWIKIVTSNDIYLKKIIKN